MQKMMSLFGDKYLNLENRVKSYDYIENFIIESHVDWKRAPDTSSIANRFLAKLKELTTEDLSFLVLHSGYIPETYLADSSQETLYSKLIEALVMEWAVRIGFPDSTLPTQKSSKEDVSILNDSDVIVCDAKSFRLGRSQAAPNVKDVLKHADIGKWLSAYPSKRKLGGLVTFPSQHDWQRGSDFYQYTTDKSSPTMCLYYEHLSFMLLSGIGSERLVTTFNNYGTIFPNVISKNDQNQSKYYSKILHYLFDGKEVEWSEFKGVAELIITERVFHCVHSLTQHVSEIETEISERIERIADVNELRKMAIESETIKATEDLRKQIDRIKKFRATARAYYEN